MKKMGSRPGRECREVDGESEPDGWVKLGAPGLGWLVNRLSGKSNARSAQVFAGFPIRIAVGRCR